MNNENASTVLIQRLNQVEDAIGMYRALRPALFRQLEKLPKGRRITYSRDPANGPLGMPIKYSHHVSTDFKIDGQSIPGGVVTAQMPETFAPFTNFQIIDRENKRVTEPDEMEIESRLIELLSQLLETSKVLAVGLFEIEEISNELLLNTDTTPVSRLFTHLPVFPYWPSMKKEDREADLLGEKPILNEALVAIHRIRICLNHMVTDMPTNLIEALRTLLDDFKSIGPRSECIARLVHAGSNESLVSRVQQLTEYWSKHFNEQRGRHEEEVRFWPHPMFKQGCCRLAWIAGTDDVAAVIRLCRKAGLLLQTVPTEVKHAWPEEAKSSLAITDEGPRWIEFLHMIGWQHEGSQSATRISWIFNPGLVQCDIRLLNGSLGEDEMTSQIVQPFLDAKANNDWFCELRDGKTETTIRDASIAVLKWLIDTLTPEATDHVSEKTAVTSNGPGGLNQFFWGTRIAELQPIASKLLAEVWNAPDRILAEEDAAERVWGHGGLPTDRAIKAAISKIGVAFSATDCPLRIGQKDGRIYIQ